jgi:quercetin dioxygenase-like cupin family protein
MGRMKKSVAIAFAVATLCAGFAVVTALPGSATPPTGGFSNTLLAQGTFSGENGSQDFVTVTITLPVGSSSSGWHSHPGQVTGIVQAGALTLYNGNHPCHGKTYSAGQAFTENPSNIYDGVNLGSIPVVLFVTFRGVPVGGSPRIDQPAPTTICPA